MSDRGFRLPSFAKINWYLKVLGRRSDGYHELETVLQTISLRDELEFVPRVQSEILLHVQGRKVATGKENLVMKAASLLRRRAGVDSGVRIRLKKRIPAGAGLGGGSSNAAVTLIALNRLWECGLSSSELHELAAELGSDVPFFLTGGMALGRGRGEEIVGLEEPFVSRRFLLLYPGFEISTAKVYRTAGFPLLDPVDQLTFSGSNTKIQRFHEILSKGNWKALENGLERAAFALCPELVEWKERLLSAGCEHVLLCGSGATLLGIGVEAEPHVVRAALQRSAPGPVECFECRTVSGDEYRRLLQIPESTRPAAGKSD